ncbi:hypothetical protein ACQ4LE_008109 [Meloidogyne hapla]|uniref:Uncharacterized protein n=1 Tax=Meloidogyne hapla TaxID=6305 RepID=A0A1I8B399_MELHA
MVIINRLLPRTTTKILFFRKFSTEIVNKSENYTKLGHSVNLFNKELASLQNQMNLKFDSTSRKMENEIATVGNELKNQIYSNKNEITSNFRKIEIKIIPIEYEIDLLGLDIKLFIVIFGPPLLVNIFFEIFR